MGLKTSVEQLNLTALSDRSIHCVYDYSMKRFYITHIALVKGVTLHLIAVLCSETGSFI